MPWADWLDKYAHHQPDRIAVIDAISGRAHTFRSFDNRANQIAHYCQQWVGLMPGDCIGLLSAPSDDVLQIVLAAGKLGLAALLLDPSASPDTLIPAINAHSPRTVFHGLAQAGLMQEIWFEVDSVEHLIPLRGAVDTANFEDIVAHYPPVPPPLQIEENFAYVRFATEGISWSAQEAVTSASSLDSGLGTVANPLHHPDGLAAAVQGLRTGHCVVVEIDTVRIIEPPSELSPTAEPEPASQRNVPRGRSWLPHRFL